MPWLSSLKNVYFAEIDRLFESKGSRLVKGVRYLSALLHQINKADVFVIGGGTLFIDKGRCNVSLLFLWCAVLFARLRRRSIIIAGVGIDILANPFSLWLTRRIFASADFVAVRDDLSLAYLGHLPPTKLRLASDLVLSGSVLVTTKGVLRSAKRKVIGICFIDYFRTLDISTTKHRMYLDRVADCLRQYQDRFDFCCLAFQEGVGQRDDWIFHELKGQFTTLSYKHLSSPADLEFLRDEIDLVLTTRFHLGLLACMLGKPVALISHELKLAALAIDFSLPTVFIDDFIEGEGFDLPKVFERFDGQEIAGKLELQRARAQRNFEWLGQ